MSWTLGIDSSSAELSVGLLREGAPFLSCSRYARNSHAEHIAAAVDFLLQSSGIRPADIERAGIAVGPGSFTGLRIGISFLKGFFFSSGTPVCPVSSLHSMAEAYPGFRGTIAVIMDARQNNGFCARFHRDGEQLARLSEDALLPLHDAAQQIDEHDLLVVDTLGFAGSAVPRFFSGRDALCAAETLCLQRGLACARIAWQARHSADAWKTATDILPNYLQASYIERKTAGAAR